MVKREQVARLNKAILAVAATALVVGCGSSGSKDEKPDTTTQPRFDGGLFAEGVNVSTVAAFEDTAETLVLDAGELAGFLDELDAAIFQVGTLGMGGRTETLLSVATASSGDDGSRRAQREARRGQSLSTFSSVSPSAGGSDEGSYTIDCAAGGTFTEDFWYEETVGDTLLKDVGGFTWTFENCAGTVGSDRFVLNGTWTETYEYDDRWTAANGSGAGSWTDTFLTEIALRGSRNGTSDALVLDGAVSGEEVGDYEWSSETEYSEDGAFALDVKRMEARLAKQPDSLLYIGQLDGSLVENFEYRGTMAGWNESGRTSVSGRIATTGMKGAATISTQKVVRYNDSSESNGDACPDEGIVVVSGRGGNTVEVRFGKDTGTTGVAVQVVTTGADFESYFSCNDEGLEYLSPLFFGPFLFAYEDAGVR